MRPTLNVVFGADAVLLGDTAYYKVAGMLSSMLGATPDKYTKVADVKYMYGARTVALDPKTHHIFSIGAVKNDPVAPTPQNANPRPRPVLTTFSLVEVGK